MSKGKGTRSRRSQTAIEIVSHGNNNYRIWLGTTTGLAYSNLKL